jgi:hypothetical protein
MGITRKVKKARLWQGYTTPSANSNLTKNKPCQ